MNVKSMARVKYSYNLDGINLTGVTTSNCVNTEVRKMGLSARKLASSQFYKTGDILTYNIVLANTGNYKTTNIVLTDDILGLELIPSTVKYFCLNEDIDLNISYELIEDNLQIKIPILEKHNTCVITYKAIVNSNLESLESKLKLASDDISETISKPLILRQGFARIECTKKVNDEVTFLNSNLTYELILKNTGNISAYNVEVFDELPSTYMLDSDNPVLCNDEQVKYQLDNNILTFSLPEVKENSEVIVYINGKIIE